MSVIVDRAFHFDSSDGRAKFMREENILSHLGLPPSEEISWKAGPLIVKVIN